MSRRKKTDYIVIHSTMTPPSRTTTLKTVDEWHRKEGWLEVGYHFFIQTDGTLEFGRHPETVGAHCKGHNHDSMSICMVGGKDASGNAVDNFSKEQKETLKSIVSSLTKAYPGATVVGHNELEETDCPSFNVKDF